MFWKLTPETDEENYISCYEALNIPNGKGNIADWYPRTYLSSPNPNDFIKTYKLGKTIGNEGITKQKITFPTKAEVYIADYVWAIIDIIIFSEREIEIKAIWGCREDFLTESEIKELFNRLVTILEKGHEKSKKIKFF